MFILQCRTCHTKYIDKPKEQQQIQKCNNITKKFNNVNLKCQTGRLGTKHILDADWKWHITVTVEKYGIFSLCYQKQNLFNGKLYMLSCHFVKHIYLAVNKDLHLSELAVVLLGY